MLSIKNISVQKWGNSLAIRIPTSIVKRAHLGLGSKIEISFETDHITLKPMDTCSLTLEQRLALFDPKIHGGEAMSTPSNIKDLTIK